MNKSSIDFFGTKLFLGITLVFIGVSLIGLFYFSNKNDVVGKSSQNKNLVQKNTVDFRDQPYLGKENAPIQIIEFGDYKCPACKDFTINLFPIIFKEYIQTGKVKFIFMNYSFISKDSFRSAKFAETVFSELGNERFWKFHDLLYNKQPDDSKYENKDFFTENFLKNTLKEISSKEDVEKVMKSFKEKKDNYLWEKDMSYVKKLGIHETPTLLINGVKIRINSYQELRNQLNQIIKSNS